MGLKQNITKQNAVVLTSMLSALKVFVKYHEFNRQSSILCRY